VGRTRLVAVAGRAEGGAVAHPEPAVRERDELAHGPTRVEPILVLPVDADVGRHLRRGRSRCQPGASPTRHESGAGASREGRTLTQVSSAA